MHTHTSLRRLWLPILAALSLFALACGRPSPDQAALAFISEFEAHLQAGEHEKTIPHIAIDTILAQGLGDLWTQGSPEAQQRLTDHLQKSFVQTTDRFRKYTDNQELTRQIVSRSGEHLTIESRTADNDFAWRYLVEPHADAWRILRRDFELKRTHMDTSRYWPLILKELRKAHGDDLDLDRVAEELPKHQNKIQARTFTVP